MVKFVELMIFIWDNRSLSRSKITYGSNRIDRLGGMPQTILPKL